STAQPPTCPDPAGNRSYSYAEKRIAGLILKRENEKSCANPTADWQRRLRWAKQVLPNLSQEWSQAKRQHTLSTAAAGGCGAKRTRTQLPRESFAEMSKRWMLIGVLDKGQHDDRIPRNQWKWVEAALAARCFELLQRMPAGPAPVCKDVGWYQGNIKVIACDNRRSVALYKAAVGRVGEVYPGAKLVALNWSDVPSQPRARIWIPTSLAKPELILHMLQRCNPQLPTHDWRVVKVEDSPGPTCQAVLKLNRASVELIEASNGELNFGFSSVFVKIYKADAAQRSERNLSSELTFSDAGSEVGGYFSDTSSLV
ncbi:hypothetical protein KR222_006515, partial [Zaprionus bogoriensis]